MMRLTSQIPSKSFNARCSMSAPGAVLLLVLVTALPGCMAIAIVDTVGTVAVKTVGLAADAAIGTVKLTGKAVGAAADVVLPDKPTDKASN